MHIEQAQREVRQAYLGGFAGQMVASVLWFISAALSTWVSKRDGVVFLTLAGTAIYPFTLAVLWAMGHAVRLPRSFPTNGLARQVAFTLPLNLPVVFAAAYYHHNWFYPALMVALGTHYLPFVFLYGMRMFAFLAGLLIVLGILLGRYMPGNFAAGAWWTAGILLVFAVLGWWTARNERLTELEA
jgi:hypothetical protein